MAEQTTVACMKDHAVQVAEFGANGTAPQAAVVAAAVATDLASVLTLANGIRTALLACGLLK